MCILTPLLFTPALVKHTRVGDIWANGVYRSEPNYHEHIWAITLDLDTYSLIRSENFGEYVHTHRLVRPFTSPTYIIRLAPVVIVIVFFEIFLFKSASLTQAHMLTVAESYLLGPGTYLELSKMCVPSIEREKAKQNIGHVTRLDVDKGLGQNLDLLL